jgi:hypothetical protein
VERFLRRISAHPVVACAVAAAFAVAAFSPFLDHGLRGPLTGHGDIPIWEGIGYYFSQHVRLGWLPHLELWNDDAFFPYGVNNVFQPWAFERDGFFAVAFSLLGPGPWLQLYYLTSLFVGAVGTFALLRSEFGDRRAVIASVLVTFFNFYAVSRYPDHLHVSVLHWTTLSLLADFLIVRRITLGRPLSVRLLLLRLALLSLSFGQDLAYICGYALLSFTVTVVFSALVVGYRRARGLPAGIRLGNAGKEVRRHKAVVIGLAVTFLAASYLYVPLAAQVAREARAFDFTGVPRGGWFESPWRLLVPYLPWLNPIRNPFRFADVTEGLGAGSVGWTFIVLAGVGLWTGRRQLLMHVPLLIVLVLCVAHRPESFPVLSVFPWFAFSRVASRATVLFPVILTTWALATRTDGRRWPFAAGVAALALLEFHTAYALRPRGAYSYPDGFFAYADVVRREPGAAVLDWPFCVAGGNGIGGSSGLCPYYRVNADDFSYRPYHQKKVVGQYFGRLSPTQIKPFVDAHWDALFAPDTPDIFQARRQTRCFREEEWAVFTEFFALNDFAGLQLHRSLLPPDCVQELQARFGRPLAEVTLPDGDSLAFIRKPDALRARIDEKRGRSFNLRPHLSGSVDVVGGSGLPIEQAGLSGTESLGQERWRWGLGRRVTLAFSVRDGRAMHVRLGFVFSLIDQEVTIAINGKIVRRFAAQPSAMTISDEVTFDAAPGMSSIEIVSSTWNGKDGRWFAPADQRPMSVRFTRLTID